MKDKNAFAFIAGIAAGFGLYLALSDPKPMKTIPASESPLAELNRLCTR